MFKEVVYICANPWCEYFVQDLSIVFRKIITLSKQFWDHTLGTVKPEYVILMTLINVLKNTQKMIVHFLQPHPPFIVDPRHYVEEVGRPSITKDEVFSRVINIEY